MNGWVGGAGGGTNYKVYTSTRLGGTASALPGILAMNSKGLNDIHSWYVVKPAQILSLFHKHKKEEREDKNQGMRLHVHEGKGVLVGVQAWGVKSMISLLFPHENLLCWHYVSSVRVGCIEANQHECQPCLHYIIMLHTCFCTRIRPS